MTSQTKKFIEISDMVGLRFDCKNPECGVSLSLPMQQGVSRTDTLQRCPHCGTPWTKLGDSDYAVQFKRLLDLLRTLSDAPLGCRFSLEIKPEPREVFSQEKTS
jgi:hypothetical protein